MIPVENRFNSIANICVYYIVIRCTWIFLSTLPIINIMIMYAAGAVLVFFSIKKHFTQTLLSIIVVLALEMIMLSFYEGDRQYYKYTIVNVIQIIIFYMLYRYVEGTVFNKAKMIKFSLIGYIITTVVSIYVVGTNPNALRTTASGDNLFEFILGYADYGYIYGMIIINILFLSYVYSYKKAFTLITVILNSILISLSGYSTAFVLNIIFILLCIVYRIQRRAIQVGLIALIILCVFFSSWLSKSFYALSEMSILPEIVQSRMEQIGDTITGKGEAEYLTVEGERMDRMTWDMSLIKEHPIAGNFITNPSAKYGMHTEWLTKMAQFGIPVGIILIGFFIKFYLEIKKKFIRNGYGLNGLRLALLYLFILGCVNPCLYQNTTFPLIVIMPFINEYAYEKNQ